MLDKRRNPVRGILSCCDTPRLHPMTVASLHVSTMAVTEFSYGLAEFGTRKLNSVMVNPRTLGVLFVDIARDEVAPLFQVLPHGTHINR
jgi:hypothetical protein